MLIHGLLTRNAVAFHCEQIGPFIKVGLLIVNEPITDGDARGFADCINPANRITARIITPDGVPSLVPGQAYYGITLEISPDGNV